MTRQSIAKATALVGLLLPSASVFAHEGHGLFGSHWHATDALGFVAVAAVVAVAVWLSGK
ncbi:MAG: hypothetical protein MUF76_12650 [Hydrogenophaga sp.]|jgi:hypothetical protein|nr:hypothetical protein [Hydrogenophaga sp.]